MNFDRLNQLASYFNEPPPGGDTGRDSGRRDSGRRDSGSVASLRDLRSDSPFSGSMTLQPYESFDKRPFERPDLEQELRLDHRQELRLDHRQEMHDRHPGLSLRSDSLFSGSVTLGTGNNFKDGNISDWGIEEEIIPTFGLIAPTHENFSKFINKYLKLRLQGEFWDRFKYNLVISNLLDDSMILSKNETNLQDLIKKSSDVQRHYLYKRLLNDDGTKLFITKHYNLKFPKNFYFKSELLNIISLIIYLLKQKVVPTLDIKQRMKMFKILLIASTRMIHYKRISTLIQMNKNLEHLTQFLILNFKINKKLILNLMHLKNFKIFTSKNGDFSKCFTHLNNGLNFLIFNIKCSIIKLLPTLNGPILEKYCEINNIDLTEEDDEDNEVQDLEVIVKKINIFNKYRKILVCQLLTIDEPTEKNFFILRLIDKFNLNHLEQEMNDLNHLTIFEKLLLLEEFFKDHNKILDSFNLVFDKFEKLYNMNYQINENEDILKLNKAENPKLNQLIVNFDKLLTNLKFFKKYNEATVDNNSEVDEKLEIFNQFSQDFNAITELYKAVSQDLHSNIETGSNTSTRNSRNSGEFSLKLFHTKHNRRSSGKEDDRNSGLKVNLLTVFEERQAKKDFNSAALESLSRLRKSNRFSINSMNSNVSGISDLITTQSSYSDENFKLKLEENLNKFYDKPTKIYDNDDIEPIRPANEIPKAFLDQLESKLLNGIPK